MGWDAHEIAAVFGRTAATYDTVIPFFSEFGARLVDLADPQPGDRVLDVGCGRGAALVPAAQRVGDGAVLGVDLAEEMVDLLTSDLRMRGIANASVRRMDAGSLDLDDGSFDIVVSSMVLHLVPDPAQVAAECRRVLRPDGRAAFSAPDLTAWDFLAGIFEAAIPHLIRPMPVPYRPDFDLGTVLEATGFEILEQRNERFRFVFPDPETWWEWSWSNGIRALFEALAPDDLEDLRRRAFAELQLRLTADGLPFEQSADFVLCRGPGHTRRS